MNESQEKLYIEGEANALKQIIVHCQDKLRGLGVELKTSEQFSPERIDIIKTLRSLCEDHGDNDWAEDLHISDILDKHLDLKPQVFLGEWRGENIFASSGNQEALKEFLEWAKCNTWV